MSGLSLFFEMVLWDHILLAIVTATGVLLWVTMLFSLSTIYLRFKNSSKLAARKAREAVWEPVLHDILSGGQPPSALWEHVPDEDELIFLDYLLRYAERFRGEARELIQQVAEPHLSHLTDRFQEGDATQRARAIRTVSVLGGASAYPVLLKALQDPSPLVAINGALGLARTGHREHAEAMIKSLGRFESWSHGFLVAMMYSMGSEAIEPLRSALADVSASKKVRAVAADTLRQLNDMHAVPIAVEALRAEGDRELVSACLRFIGKFGRAEHLPWVYASCQATDFVVRAHAVRALGRMARLAAVPRLQQALDDPSTWVAIHAAWGLKEAGAMDQLKALALSSHPRSALARQLLVVPEAA